MKRQIFMLLLVVFAGFTACKNEKKEQKETAPKSSYTLNAGQVKIGWTGYKTTEKIPVKGTFKKVELLNQVAAETPVKTINQLKFRIPVNSIFSNDSIRDFKLRNSLFGTMKNTANIEGEISLTENGKGTAQISLNGLSKDIPVTYTEKDGEINIHAVIDLNNWQAQAAVAALNAVCEDKHKAADGISKTWSEVAIDVTAKPEKQ